MSGREFDILQSALKGPFCQPRAESAQPTEPWVTVSPPPEFGPERAAHLRTPVMRFRPMLCWIPG